MKDKKPPLFGNLYDREFTHKESILMLCITILSVLGYLLLSIYKL